MITSDGWLDWAERVPGPPEKVYPEGNAGIGYVPHSAVGHYGGWESRLFGAARVSVHGWIAYDGSVKQHYSLTAGCWASGSRYPNTHFIAFENEGGLPGNESEPLTEEQVLANVRILRELAQWRGWISFRRPVSPDDTTANLYEHNECVRFGSEPTACPSGRIPWQRILDLLAVGPAAPSAPPGSPMIRVILPDAREITLDVDEYAKGVVPNEMASGWPAEALKAQAVVAKSYAIAKAAPLLTTTADQVYEPSRRAPDTDAAVDAVRGVYAAFQGQIVMPFYFGHCEGRTRSPSQAGWATTADRPFLQPVDCGCGRGEYFGHGIGMCQEGARAMAQAGAGFDAILRHYYQGIELPGLAPAGASPEPPAFETYEVQAGDSLLSIAQRFGLEWGVLFEANRDLIQDPNVVPPGILLRVPVSETDYVVQTGDTLFSLARRWGCTVAAIVELNAIADARLIRLGQRLKRPR